MWRGPPVPADPSALAGAAGSTSNPVGTIHGRCGALRSPLVCTVQDLALLVARRRLGGLCPRGAFSHVVAYTRQTSALRGTAHTLLDAAAAGFRCVRLSPAPATNGPRV